ncbi:antigenic protein, partial [Trypanosoma cruzi]
QKARGIINAVKTEYQRQPFVLPEPQETEQLQRANDSPRAPLDEPPLTKEGLESEEEAAHQLMAEDESEAMTAALGEASGKPEAAELQRQLDALRRQKDKLRLQLREARRGQEKLDILRRHNEDLVPFFSSDVDSSSEGDVNALLGSIDVVMRNDFSLDDSLSDMDLYGLCMNLARLVLRLRERVCVQREALKRYFECQDRLRESNEMRIRRLEEEFEDLLKDVRRDKRE